MGSWEDTSCLGDCDDYFWQEFNFYLYTCLLCVDNNNCDEINNQTSCESEGCNWVLSPTYNPYWDQYTETIPQGLTGIQHSYFFLGCEPNQGECGAFNHVTEEIFSIKPLLYVLFT